MPLDWLDDAAIALACGGETFSRGVAYAKAGKVRQITWSDSGSTLTAVVQGNRTQPYVIVILIKAGPGNQVFLTGQCTCPMRVMCKHVAAALIVGRSELHDFGATDGAPPSTWRRTLQAIAGPVASSTAAPMALQLTIQQPLANDRYSSAVSRYRLGARPMLMGRKDRWVHTNISWHNLRYARHELNPAHLRIASALLSLHPAGGTSYYGGGSQWMDLAQINSTALWPLLAEAQQVGMAIILEHAEQPPVVVSDRPLEVAFDITRSESGLVLLPQLLVGTQSPPGQWAGFIGRPSHGTFIWEQDPATGKVTALTLVPLTRSHGDDLIDVLLSQTAITVPPHEESVFLVEAFPTLAQRYSILSSDSTFTAPDPAHPFLHLLIRHQFGHAVSLEWSWSYATTAETAPPVGNRLLWPRSGEDFRDGPAEAALLSQLDWLLESRPELAVPGTSRLASNAVLSGLAMLSFLANDLPALPSEHGVIVAIEGEEVEYVAMDASPEVRVGLQERRDSWDWFDLEVTVTVSGQDVPFDALFRALNAKQDVLILPSGYYLRLDSPELERLRTLIEEARELRESARDGLGISRYHVDLWAELLELGVVDVQSAAWQQSIARLARGESAPSPELTPGSILADPRPYQMDGFTWLASLRAQGLGGVLADDMGLGKTLQAIMAMVEGRKDGDAPYLVVAPTSVTGNWARECERFAPGLTTVVISETSTRRGHSLAEAIKDADVVITSYALFRLDFDEIDECAWAGLWLDEAQFVKNRQSQGYACARRLSAPFKVAITGTPMENNLMELWSLLSITAPGLFPSPDRFADYYQKPIERELDEERLTQLRRRIRPFMLRRTKEQVAGDLPPKQEQVMEIDLHPRHHKIYQRHLQRERQKILKLIEDMQSNRFEVFRSLTMLRQLSLDASLVDEAYAGVPSAKLDVLVEMLDGITAEGHRTLVFSQFTGYLAKVRARLDAAGIAYSYLDGRTRKRQEAIEAFTQGTVPVFLISLKAGGFGLNLTAADYVIMLDPWWNPATEAQAIDRTHRIGQDKKVMVYRLVARETIEERVMAMKEHKAALFDAVMTGTSAKGTALSSDEIRELLT